MGAPWQTTISKKSPPFTLSSVSVVVFKLDPHVASLCLCGSYVCSVTILEWLLQKLLYFNYLCLV
ncbi:hypothetical protein OIU79_021245 [Salix purpurea]|uniref:Uncharacterized protein n=1 Tax=Salix purpurea TaxID=77065 RepID=A0A9Q0WNH1_SALPP|nr:hypothetical protein OIU79_021245 [Salix purpurea]